MQNTTFGLSVESLSAFSHALVQRNVSQLNRNHSNHISHIRKREKQHYLHLSPSAFTVHSEGAIKAAARHVLGDKSSTTLTGQGLAAPFHRRFADSFE